MRNARIVISNDTGRRTLRLPLASLLSVFLAVAIMGDSCHIELKFSMPAISASCHFR
jgi:hypothetical protein